MLRRIALLVDVGFVLKRLRPRLGRPALAEDVMAECRRVLNDPRLAGRELLPAFKFARREGVRVDLDHLGSSVSHELEAHVVVVL